MALGAHYSKMVTKVTRNDADSEQFQDELLNVHDWNSVYAFFIHICIYIFITPIFLNQF